MRNRRLREVNLLKTSLYKVESGFKLGQSDLELKFLSLYLVTYPYLVAVGARKCRP